MGVSCANTARAPTCIRSRLARRRRDVSANSAAYASSEAIYGQQFCGEVDYLHDNPCRKVSCVDPSIGAFHRSLLAENGRIGRHSDTVGVVRSRRGQETAASDKEATRTLRVFVTQILFTLIPCPFSNSRSPHQRKLATCLTIDPRIRRHSSTRQ